MRRLSILLVLLAAATPLCAADSPAATYVAYHTALKQSATIDGIQPYQSEHARAEFARKYPEHLRGRVFYMMKTSSPQTVQVAKETITGDSAELDLRAEQDGERLVGTATLRLENGEWKLEQVVWRRQ